MYLGEDVFVAVDHQDWMGTTSIYIGVRDAGKVKVAQPVELVFTALEEGVAVDHPTLRLDRGFAWQLLTALAEALDAEGIKTPKDASLEGELKATKYHLEDMRKLTLGGE